MTESYMTRDGLEKLKKELTNLKQVKIKCSADIAEAREKGDLKENAEYHAAKEKLGEIMGRISRVQDSIASARMIEDIEIKEGEVQIGVKVSLQEIKSKMKMDWILVGGVESDPTSGKISVDSPLAQGLLGHKVGEEVTVALPAGSKTFKILKTEAAV
ncbi:MAG: transcription elongation factor GreA [Elusimicrobia bacterium]|nr:MAG: transcription elongation factor GreA [Elusimicrobiota bacterium]